MTKKFVISTDPLTAAETEALKDVIRPASWWHWLPNFWLVKDTKDELTAESIRDSIKRINTTARCVVLEVEPGTWAALTKKDAQGRDMGSWLKSTWSND